MYKELREAQSEDLRLFVTSIISDDYSRELLLDFLDNYQKTQVQEVEMLEETISSLEETIAEQDLYLAALP